MSGITQEQMDNWFTYHTPKGDQQQRYVAIRKAGKALADVIVATTGGGDDQDAAVRKVREAVMTANSAIACGEAGEDNDGVAALTPASRGW